MIRAITPLLSTGPYEEGCKVAGVSVVDVRALVDKAGNAAEDIRRHVDEAASLLRAQKKVIICCDYGMSRSNSIAAGALSRLENISAAEAIRRVIKATGETEIKFEMIHAVAAALGETAARAGATKIVVTGATGDIGAKLLPRLKNAIGLSSKEIDLLQGTQLFGLYCLEQKPTHIIHLASPRIISTNKSIGEEITILKNVADVAKLLGIKLVYLSSSQVFAGKELTAPLLADENTAPAPAGYLGFAKSLGEQLLQDMKLDACILRIGQVYGSGLKKPRFLAYFIDRLKQNLPVTTHRFSNGEPCVDLLHINDLVTALEQAISSNMKGLHHIGRGETLAPKEVVSLLKNKLNSASPLDSAAMEGTGSKVVLKPSLAATMPLETGLKDLL